LKWAYERKKVSLLFVCNVRLISTKPLMVEDGVALMKLLKVEKEDGVIVDKRWIKELNYQPGCI
jgi:hypothetical protein